MSISYSIEVYADWNGDGDFGDANEDLTDYFVDAEIARGRSDINDEYSPGSMMLTLNNESGLFSLYNTGSALYGSILPGVEVKLDLTVNATAYTLYRGFISVYTQSRASAAWPYVVFECLDELDRARFGLVRLGLQENKRVDQLLTAVCDDPNYNWPAGLRNFDTAYTTVETYAKKASSPLDHMRTIAMQELGEALFVSRDGKWTFYNRWHNAAASTLVTLNNKAIELQLTMRREDLIDAVEFKRAGLSVDASVIDLFTLTPSGRRIEPGSTSALNVIQGEFDTGGRNVVTPVANTDYTANSEPDGTGTDKTAQVTIDSFTTYGGSFEAVVASADSSPVYLTLFKVRGEPIKQSNEERIIRKETASPIITGQVLSKEFAWNDDADEISSYASLIANTQGAVQPRPPVILKPETNSDLETFAQAELNDRVRLVNTSGLHPTQVDEYFHIGNIRVMLKPKALPQFHWKLFHEDFVHGNLLRVSPDAGSAAEYGLISSDVGAPTHRIGV